LYIRISSAKTLSSRARRAAITAASSTRRL
jgi:hypothetical protein